MADTPKPRAWRPVLRNLHRDAGYLAVGLTLVYALSGLAVNHVAQWDPNFKHTREVHALGGPLRGEPGTIAADVLRRLGVSERPREVYSASPEQLDVLLARGEVHINPRSGRVVYEGQRPRFAIRIANWLHLNRGKRAWTVVADLYAAGLLFLAVSGMLMLPGRRGLVGRGGVLVAVGVAVPVLYVVLSGGP